MPLLAALLWATGLLAPAQAQSRYYLSEFKPGKGFEMLIASDSALRFEKIYMDKQGFFMDDPVTYRTTMTQVKASTSPSHKAGFFIESGQHRGWANLSVTPLDNGYIMLNTQHEGKPKFKWTGPMRGYDSLSIQQCRSANEAYLALKLGELYEKLEDELGEKFDNNEYLARFTNYPPSQFGLSFTMDPVLFRQRFKEQARAIEIEARKHMTIK